MSHLTVDDQTEKSTEIDTPKPKFPLSIPVSLIDDPLSEEEIEAISDDNLINFAQASRKRIAKNLLNKGDDLCDDDTKLLLTVLDSLSTTAVMNKRIKSSEKEGVANRNTALIVAKMAKEYKQQISDSEGNIYEGEVTNNGEIPTLDVNALEGMEVLESSKVIGNIDLSLSEFMTKYENSEGD